MSAYKSERLVTGRLTLAVCFALASVIRIFAQSTGAELTGRVMDPQGARVAGASVVIRALDTGLERETATDERGYYRAVSLPPGQYELTARVGGFDSSVHRGVALTVGELRVINFNLTISAVQEQIVVRDSPGVETTGSTISGLVDEKRIRELPLNGRDMAQLILLQPGVVNSRSSVQGPTTGRGARFSVGGARPSQNQFTLDGTTINDALNNTPGSAQGLLVGVETVREFRVLTSAYSAEYGRSPGGVFLAVTKSGANDLHGSLFEFLRNQVLDARNFFDQTKPPFRRNQFGATVGGPIIRNKTFFFASWEGLRERKGITAVSLVPDQDARLGIIPGMTQFTVDPRSKPLLDLFPLANGPSLGGGAAAFTGVTNRYSNDDFATAKVDHYFSAKDSMFARYLYDDSSQLIARSFPEFPNIALNTKQVATLQERHIFTPNVVNEARVGFNRTTPQETSPPTTRNLQFIAGKSVGELAVAGLSAVGTDRSNPKLFFQNSYQFSDMIYVTKGRHNVQMGASLEHLQINGDSESRSRGQLLFRNVADLARFRIQNMQGASSDSDFVRGYRQSLTGVFVQDEFRVAPRLTLSLGFRYEFLTGPTEVNGKTSNLVNIMDPQMTIAQPFFKPTHKNLAPRFGFASDLFGDGKTSLRGGFGIFNDEPLYHVYRSPIFRSLPYVNRGRLTPDLIPSLPVQSALFKGVDQITETFEPYTVPAYLMQYNLNIQRLLFSGTTLSVAFVGSRGVNLFGTGDVNTAIPQVLADGRDFFPAGSLRRNTHFDQVERIYQGFSSRYNSLNVSLVRRFAQGLEFQTSYTFGKSIDDRSDTNGRTEFSNGQARAFDPYKRFLDKARSDFDTRHTFVSNVVYEFPFGKNLHGVAKQILAGWQLNGIVSLSSGLPFTPMVAGDAARAASDDNAARPNLIPGVSLMPAGGRTPNNWFNLAAFTAPQVGFRGTSGRNIVTGPTLKNFDLSVVKNFHVSERIQVQFRAEAFNLLNHANFALPQNAEEGEQLYTYTPAAGNTPGFFTNISSAGQIFSTVTDSREIQFGLKLIF